MGINIRNYLNRTLDIPADTLSDYPLIHITANNEITVENHKGIVEFNSNSVKLKSKLGIISISGILLRIKVINENDIIITGRINSVEYCS